MTCSCLPPHIFVDTVNVVKYKLTLHVLQQMQKHETVQRHDDERLLNRNRQDKVTIANKYKEHRLEYLKHVKQSKYRWHGHLGRIKMKKHCMKVHNNFRPVCIATYRVGPKVKQFAATEIDRLSQGDVTELANNMWASLIMFAPKKNGSIQFCVD